MDFYVKIDAEGCVYVDRKRQIARKDRAMYLEHEKKRSNGDKNIVLGDVTV